jgi:SEC-C motif-containing protein
MRSRFSAFAVGDPTYLLATWHPSTRPASLELPAALEWRKLEIVATTAGGGQDDEGTVEFIAHFWDDAARKRGHQHENSAFVREAGHWFYLGEAPTGEP